MRCCFFLSAALGNPFSVLVGGFFGFALLYRFLRNRNSTTAWMKDPELVALQAEIDAFADAWHQQHDPPGVYAARQRGKREGQRLAGLTP